MFAALYGLSIFLGFLFLSFLLLLTCRLVLVSSLLCSLVSQWHQHLSFVFPYCPIWSFCFPVSKQFCLPVQLCLPCCFIFSFPLCLCVCVCILSRFSFHASPASPVPSCQVFESVNLCLFISCFILLVSRLLCHVCNFASLVLLPQWVPAVFPGVSHLPNYLVCIYCLSPVCLLLCLLHMVCVSLHRAPCVFLLEFCCKVKLSSKSYLLSPTLGSTSCLPNCDNNTV